jgi:hypothetical protein
MAAKAKMWNYTWKITKAKRAGDVAQVVEHLARKCDAFVQTPILPKKKSPWKVVLIVSYFNSYDPNTIFS